MDKIVICSCPEKPEINTDGPLVQAVAKYCHNLGIDVSKREGNAIKDGNTWHVAYYESDLELVARPEKKRKGKR
jgi:hypothetical protein